MTENMNKKKVLICIDWFLPGTNSGGPVRSYSNLIDHLKDDYEFFVITRDTDYASQTPYPNITPDSWNLLGNYLNVYYISDKKLKLKHFNSLINSQNFDFVFINGIYSWYFSILPVWLFRKTDTPIIVSVRGMLSPQAFSIKRFRKKLFLSIAKLTGFYRNVLFHATNNDEAEYINSRLGYKINLKVAPNLPRKIEAYPRTTIQKQTPIRFVSTGRISFEKGTLIMLNAFTKVSNGIPIRLDIYGSIADKTYWEKCNKIIQVLPESVKVCYKGSVSSEDIPGILCKYDFFVLLSEGENFGHSIVEAMSAGLPVLISNLTPWKNLEKQLIGWDVDPKNENEVQRAFNAAINMDAKSYEEFSSSAYNYAKDINDNPEIIKQNKELFTIS